MKITEANYLEEADMMSGYCTECDEITRNCTEGDAEGYECPECENETVIGMGEALYCEKFQIVS